MRLTQEHIFAQARKDAHSILVDWDNGVITAQEAYNNIIKLKEAGTGYKTVPRYDINNPHPFGTFFNDPLERKLVDYLTGMDIVSANDPPYLDQYDHDYIKKMYKDINNPKKPEETIPEPDEFIQGELDLAGIPPDNPPVLGERDAVIQKADELRKSGKTDEALDLYRHAATLPTPTV